MDSIKLAKSLTNFDKIKSLEYIKKDNSILITNFKGVCLKFNYSLVSIFNIEELKKDPNKVLGLVDKNYLINQITDH